MREQNGLFLVEGEKLCNELLNSDFEVELLVLRDHPSQEALALADTYANKGVAIYTASKLHFDQLSETKSPQSIIAVGVIKEITPNFNKPFIVLDGVSDPGNVGTIIRTADWFGINQVILGNESADKYNSKTVRATMGSIFRSSIVTTENLSEYISSNYKDFECFGASLGAKTYIDKISPQKKFGIVFGNESEGISEKVKKILTKEFKIRGTGKTDSLNVGVAAGIALHYFTNFK
ncbi:MAG: RNA methyltransferase [Candidatus Kapabacteria bacterium]|nr:RNA methyltransferase [Candidatus Kapabacteria bacterium]